MANLIAENIFRIHPHIRWAGLASESGVVIFSKMRAGVESYTPEEDDQYLLEFGGLVMDGIIERSSQWLGKCDYVIAAYDKATQLVIRVKDGYLALTVDKSVPANEVVGIAKAISRLESP
jgi:hypothetical protein